MPFEITVKFTVNKDKVPGNFHEKEDFEKHVVADIKNHFGPYKPREFETSSKHVEEE